MRAEQLLSLTPALSLRERENGCQHPREADAPGTVERLTLLPPLPDTESLNFLSITRIVNSYSGIWGSLGCNLYSATSLILRY